MRKKTWILTISLCAAMAFGLAFALDWRGGNPSQQLIERYDQNGNDKPAKDEFPVPDQHFTQMDLDRNGFITLKEIEQASQPEVHDENRGGVPGQFTEDDADGDGVVSRTEFSGPADHFDRLDLDGNGVITENEARQDPPGMARLERRNR